MKSSTARATSKPTARATTGVTTTERGRASPARTRASPARTPARTGASPARNRGSLTKTTTMAAAEPTFAAPRRSVSSAAPIRQSAIPTRIPIYTGSRALVSTGTLSPPLNRSLEGNSAVKPHSMSTTTRIPGPNVVKGTSPVRKSVSPKQIRSHEFLSKTSSESRGHSPLSCSIDEEPNQLRRHSAPSSKLQDYMSRSHDYGSFALNGSIDRGPKPLSKSQNQGPKAFSTSQDRGYMSRSQDRGSYANQDAALWKSVAVPEYGYDGRRKSTSSSRDAFAPRLSSAGLNRRDSGSLHLLMGRSVDSTMSFSTGASSPMRGNRQSFRDGHRLVPLQLSDPVVSQGYRSGELTPEEASPVDGRAPAWKHRQLKSPDFFDVKKLDGDGGVITAVSRVHHKTQRTETTGTASSEDDRDVNRPKLHLNYEQRRDRLADSARQAFSVETDSVIGSSHFSSEINYKLEKALHGAQDLLEVGSWNDDDEEYLRVYKHERSVDPDTKTSDSVVAVSTSNGANGLSKNWGPRTDVGNLSQYNNALYQKSEPDSDLGISPRVSPQASPPRATIATQPAAVSRISSTSATSIDLNRSTDTTCSTYSQYDNAFWADPPSNGTFRPWNPKREAEMSTPSAAVPSTLPVAELADPPPESPPVATAAALNESRLPRYNDGLERLTSYMKTASQSARNKRGLSDDLSSSQASGCFDYLVDFLDSQQTSIADVLVSAHDETLKLNDFAHPVGAAGGAHVNPAAVKRLDSKTTNDTAMLSNRSNESRITDLGSEASWESGKSRSVQTLGTTGGKVMDQITEKVGSLSFDSPKHLSTFKFGLKKTTLGACETITSSDQAHAKPDGAADFSPPQRKSVSIPVSHQQQPPSSPRLSCPSQTAPSSISPSRTPSRTPSRNPSRSRSPSRRAFSEEKLNGIVGHRLPSPLSSSSRQIKIVSEAGVESRREEDSPPPSSDNPPVAEHSFSSPELLPQHSFKKIRVDSPKLAAAVAGSTSPTVEPPSKNVQMQHSGDDRRVGSATPDRALKRRSDGENLSLRLDQANKGCGCNIL